jgi:hypothetical protein
LHQALRESIPLSRGVDEIRYYALKQLNSAIIENIGTDDKA